MTVVGNRITRPVSREEMADILSTSRDVGTICRSDSVAKWAKYKPVEYDTTGELTEEQRKSTNCGMIAPGVNNTPAVAVGSPDEAIKMTWSWKKPSTWFRVLDFEGYRTDAHYPPIMALSTSHNSFWGGGLTLARNPYSTGNDGTIQYGDINALVTRPQRESLALGKWYLGMLATRNGNRYLKTTQGTLDISPMVSLTSQELAQIGGDFSYYLFLCDTRKPNLISYNQQDPSLYFYPALCDDPAQMKGDITVNTTSGISIQGTGNITSANSGNNKSNPFSPDISRYVGAFPPPDPSTGYDPRTDPSYYMGVVGSGSWNYTMTFLFRLSSSSGAHALDISKLKIKIVSNLSGEVNLTYTPESILDYDAAKVSGNYVAFNNTTHRLTIPASGNIGVVVNLPNNVLSYNSRGMQDPDAVTQRRLVTGSFQLIYGDMVMVDSINIRIRNNI